MTVAPARRRRTTPGEDVTTLRVDLGSHDNALNFVRLVLALLVIVWHVAPLTGLPAPAWVFATDLGALAVNGFFIISGYLVLGSALRTPARIYAQRRALRIYPALWVNVILIAWVVAPLVAWLRGTTWTWTAALQYALVHGISLPFPPGVAVGDGSLDLDTLAGQPFPSWNGSLWTLPFEVAAYVAVGLLVRLKVTRRWPAIVCASFLVAALVIQPFMRTHLAVTTNLYLHGVRLATFFLAGALLFALGDRLRLRGDAAGVCLILVVGGLASGLEAWMWLPIPYAYALLYAGARLPIRIGTANDLSYGVYIYAFPLQQLAFLVLGPRLGWWGHLVLTTGLTLMLAGASWLLVERPALRRGHRRAVAPVAPAKP